MPSFLPTRRWHRQPRPGRAASTSRACSGDAAGGVAAGGGHGPIAMRAFASSQTAGGIPKLRAAARARRLIGCGAASQSPARISVCGVRGAGIGPMGRSRAADPPAGIAVCRASTAARRGLRGGRAGDPPGSFANDRPFRPARLLLAIDGLDDPTGGVANHLAAGLCR